MEEFNIKAKVSRAYKDNKTGKIYIEGIASSSSIDLHETIFSQECQKGWEKDFQDGLPTYIELNHDGKRDFTKRIGKVTEIKCITDFDRINEDGEFIVELFVRAELDKDNPNAIITFNAINNPKLEYGQPEELGLSINGYVTKMRLKSVGDKVIEVYDRARLEMIGVVEYASNPDTFVKAIKRSIENNIIYKKEISRMSIEKEVVIEIDNKESIDETSQIVEVSREVIEGETEIKEEEIVEIIDEVKPETIEEEKSQEIIIERNNDIKILREVVSKIESIEDLKTETLINTIRFLVNQISSIDNSETEYKTLYERNIENKLELLSLKEVNREVVKVEVKDSELTKVNEVLISLNEAKESFKRDNESLKSEIESLKKDIERVGNMPINNIATVNPSSISPKELNFREIERAYKEGKMTVKTREAYETALTEMAWGITK